MQLVLVGRLQPSVQDLEPVHVLEQLVATPTSPML